MNTLIQTVVFLGLLTIIQANVCMNVRPVVPRNLCSGNGRAYFGDFNGDRKEDFVCHNSVTGENVIHYAPREAFQPIVYRSPLKWCIGTHSRFFVADFNGDGRSDFLCHTVTDGNKWIAYANQDGTVTKNGWFKRMKWCAGKGQLFVGDFNGDRRADMLCHNHQGKKWISYANHNGQFVKTDWHNPNFPRCKGVLLTGDFNGDRKTDIMCHVRGGTKYVAFAGAPNSVFTKNHWVGQKGWCSHSGSFVTVGDVNADGFDDIVCKDRRAGNHARIWYSKNNRGNIRNLFGVTTFRSIFCSSSHPYNFHLADVNLDGRKDFICVNKLGHVQVGLSTCV